MDFDQAPSTLARWAVYAFAALFIAIATLALWHLANLGFFSGNEAEVKSTAAGSVAYSDVVEKTLLPMFQYAATALITFILGSAGVRMVKTLRGG